MSVAINEQISINEKYHITVEYRKQNTEFNMNLDASNQAFFDLLDNPKIRELLLNDKCYVIADKYILATVLCFFRRANFNKSDYNCRNFYLALYLVHEVYEEIEDFKEEIMDDYVSDSKYHEKFLQNRFVLFQKLQFNASITRQMCECIMNRAPHWAWKRTRNTKHSGVFYKYTMCKKCL